MTSKIGFTGTQTGLNQKQLTELTNLLVYYSGDGIEFHHGDCIGADSQVANIAQSLGFWIVCHPPINEYKRAFNYYDETRDAKDFLERNHDIVDETEIMIGCPKESKEQLRSGTWATIRYSKKKYRFTHIIYPE